MRNSRLVRAALLLLPATFVLAASCVGESETDFEEDVLDEDPTAEAPLALDGGCTTDGGKDSGADGSTDSGADGSTDSGADGSTDSGTTDAGWNPPWPNCSPSDLWSVCGIPRQEGLKITYGSLDGDKCGETAAVANGTTWCKPEMVLDPLKPTCTNACAIFKHELCHVAQIKSLCTLCQQGYPSGGAAFVDCVIDSGNKCRRTMESQCYGVGCKAGDPSQCSEQAYYCNKLQTEPPSGSGLSCDTFTAGAGSCACGNMGVGYCGSGTCSSGKTCTASSSACTCVSPPPPQDAGSDGSTDGSTDGSSDGSSDAAQQ